MSSLDTERVAASQIFIVPTGLASASPAKQREPNVKTIF